MPHVKRSTMLAAFAFVCMTASTIAACSNSSSYIYGGRALEPPDSDGGIDLIPADGGSVPDNNTPPPDANTPPEDATLTE
jgi:hypothetical protein